MENSDDFIQGTFDPNNPVNRKEIVLPTSENLMEAFTAYETLQTLKSKKELLGFIAEDMTDAEKYREAKLTMERLTAWKKIRFDLYAKVDDSEITKQEIQNAIDKIKMLKKKLCEILK